MFTYGKDIPLEDVPAEGFENLIFEDDETKGIDSIFIYGVDMVWNSMPK